MAGFSSPGHRNSAAAAKAQSMRTFVRLFFIAAGLIALAMVAYVFQQDMHSSVTGTGGKAIELIGFEQPGGVRGGIPGLEPRPGHSHGGGSSGEVVPGHSHGSGGHSHDHDGDGLEGEDSGLDKGSAGSLGHERAVSEKIERAVVKVVRRTVKDPTTGQDTIEETVYYSAASEAEALELANELIKDGTDVTIREGSSGASSGGSQPGSDSGAGSGGSGSGSSGGDGHGHDHGHDHGDPEKPAEPPAEVKQPPKTAPQGGEEKAWAPLEIPGWTPQMNGKQRPVKGEADVTSHALNEATQHSMNPPRNARDLRALLSEGKPAVDETLRIGGGQLAAPTGAALRAAAVAGTAPETGPRPLSGSEVSELEHRIVIAIALGVHSGSKGSQVTPGDKNALQQLSIVKTLLGTLLPVAQAHFVYRFYFAFDHNDPVYEKAANRKAIEEMFVAAFEAEDAKRWHPEGSVPGVLDGSRLAHSIHWVHCDYSGKPSWAHSDAVVSAYKEGSDYAFRTNDDSAFPANPDWADKFITELRGRQIPNVGVVGPTCNEGANWILTHDFTHKTHVAIFGWQYPRGLPDWSSDDWVTYIYSGFNLMAKLPDVITAHTMSDGTRYNPTNQATRLAVLNSELQRGSQVLDAWLKEKGVTIPYQVKHVECC